MVTRMSKPLSRLGLILAVLGFQCPSTSARIRCFSIFDCEHNVRKGSECVDGFCTNPYHWEGCLPARLKDHYKIRTCNSEDPPSSVEKGFCKPSSLGYTEVRIGTQNWESVFFVAWIMQILLSELLDVPTTLETSSPTAKLNFYDIDTSFDYGKSNDFDAIRRANQVKDCRVFKDSENYTTCMHVLPEVWTGQFDKLDELQEEQEVEPPGGIGSLGHQMWFMRRNTAKKFPNFITYLGLEGEENRHALAEVFKRPTTWEDYCALVSKDGCETPDKVAQRPPSAGEENKYYEAGEFTGFFRATEHNNCTRWPTNCTGHIVDFPCGWASFVLPQTYHLGIALESNGKQPGSNGYSYGEMVQIWNSANETDSDVLMQWWRPESLYQQFLGSQSEFQQVTLPPATQDCVEHRIQSADRCSDDLAVRVGDPRGACEEPAHAVKKAIANALFDISFDPEVPEALHSPAYEAVKNFRLSDLQMGKMFDYWFAVGRDKWNLDPRDATCQWVIENLEEIMSYVPRTHPRIMEDNDTVYKEPIFYVAIGLSCLAALGSIASIFALYMLRNKTVIRYSQIEFLLLLLVGLTMVSVGALMSALPPTDQICVSVVWFVNFGYTLELVPLIVKVAAIHRLMVATQQMRRVKLRMVSLFGAVLFFCVLVGVSLIVWTSIDPPRRDEHITLTDSLTENGETVIERTYFCSSDQDFWNYMGVSWQLLLLLCASVLAFQTRKMREDMNETRTLAMLIYSHFVFVSLRAVTYVLDGSLNHADLTAARALIYSIDALATLSIYFLPKFLMKDSGSQSPWLKSTAVETPSTPAPLNVHTWRSKQPSSGSKGSKGSGSATNSRKSEDRLGTLSSLRQSSADYRTQAEWDQGSDTDHKLEEISEEGGGSESASQIEENRDEFTNYSTDEMS